MNKKELNNEIVLCRAAVRKARVIVIRKLLKKMKILKACKIEGVNQKKQKKAERLFEKVQMLKKVKDHEVTQFALRNTNPESNLEGQQANPKQSALACLAMHETVAKKVASIRERFSDWETELLPLLDSMGKKKSAKKSDSKAKNEVTKETDKNRTSGDDLGVGKSKKSVKSRDDLGVGKSKKSVKSGDDKGLEKSIKSNKVKSKPSLKKTLEKPTTRTSKNLKDTDEDESDSEESDSSSNDMETESSQIQKIDDPFFIEKKVIAPRLLLEGNDSVNKSNFQNRTFSNDKEKFWRDSGNSTFQTKPFKVKKELRTQKPQPAPAEEKLHPSWAAKKVKLIQPFQGKKIKFSEE